MLEDNEQLNKQPKESPVAICSKLKVACSMPQTLMKPTIPEAKDSEKLNKQPTEPSAAICRKMATIRNANSTKLEGYNSVKLKVSRSMPQALTSP